MAGLTAAGLEIKRLPDVLTANRLTAGSLFSDRVLPGDEVDVSENATLGRMIGIVAPAEAALWEGLQQVYDSFNPNTAIGISLDNIVSLSGINRFPARPTRAQVVLEGSTNTLITASSKVGSTLTQRVFSMVSPVALTPQQASGIGIAVSLVQDSTNYTVNYSTDGVSFISITINSGVSATATSILTALQNAVNTTSSSEFNAYFQDGRLFISRVDPFQVLNFTTTTNLSIQKVQKLGVVQDDVVGPFEQPAFSLDLILIPVIGWEKVSNPLKATVGSFKETDEELRERFRNSKFFQAANILESLIDALKNVEGVSDITVYENDTDTVSSLGVPPHSFLPVVLGGLNTEIGEAIWQNKPTGIKSAGDTTVSITDSQGLIHAISFKRPAAVPIYVSVTIMSTGAGTLPGDAVARIKQNIKDYGDANYLIGDDVVYSRLYSPVNAVPGHQVNSLTLGTAPAPVGNSNIVIAFDEVASFSTENISVTIV